MFLPEEYPIYKYDWLFQVFICKFKIKILFL